ncbi:MAG: MBL fold metallo-hydrolase, partial [Bacillota bacterium]
MGTHLGDNMEIWNGNGCSVYKTETHRCICYIIKSNKSSVLVDTSVKFERAAITNSFRDMGINKIDAIFLTHSHTDHVANAKYLSDSYHCPVYIAQKGIEKVRRGNCVMPKG